jgi:hypothetical protein
MSKFALAAAALTAASFAGQANAQSLDVSIAGTQVLQNVNNGTAKLTAGKSTFVRVGLAKTGTIGPNDLVDGILRVFVNGVETADSPIYSVNGPLLPPVSPSPANLNDSLNFQFIPPGGLVELRVEVNPAGPNQVAETNFANNNVTIPAVTYFCKGIPEMVYVPIDYRPSGGGTPNLPDPLLIEPGIGDNFFQGIYGAPDVEYRIYDQGFKLWTQSLSGSGSSLNTSLTNELQMMNPKPDFMYGWVPGGLPYNGQTNFTTAMGNTQNFKHQRTMAHEHGHILGKSHNSASITTIGIDVERQLNLPLALPQVMGLDKKDIMAAGLNTNQAWVWPVNANFFYEHPAFNCDQPATFGGDTVYLSGIYNRATGQFDLGTVMTLENMRAMPSVPAAEGDLVFQILGTDGVTELERTGFSWGLHCFGDVENATDPLVSVAMTLPQTIAPSQIGAVRIIDRQGNAVNNLVRSANAPVAAFTSPRPTQLIPDKLTLEWTATDVDGDALNQHLRYSPDGYRYVALGTLIEGNSFDVDMRRLPRLEVGKGFFELIVSDGLNTTVARSTKLRPTIQFASFAGGLPDTHILTPDSGLTYPKGAPVILHSSGWDLEDRALTGNSVVWTSDVDGFLTTGRITSVDNLSVGTHTITVTVTDSANQTDSDSAVITILDRNLPGNQTICQTDIGFGGPGSSTLSVCGGDLSTGTTVDVQLTGAAPSAPMWLVVGSTNAPLAFLGGLVVPSTPSLIQPAATDATGSFLYSGFQGGGGPNTLYVQALYLDLSQPSGAGISNAVQVQILP